VKAEEERKRVEREQEAERERKCVELSEMTVTVAGADVEMPPDCTQDNN